MKITKRDREIKRAIETLKKHNVSVFTLENDEFLEDWIFEQWEVKNLKPTPLTLKRVREKAMEYILAESWEVMQDAIEYVSLRQSTKQK
jgi:hypothetical protein